MIVSLMVLGVLALQSLDFASGSATLKVHMIEYRNSRERAWDNDHCDKWGIGRCDHEFTFCLDVYNSPTSSVSSCRYSCKQSGSFRDRNVNYFGSSISGVSNPIVQTFSTWPSQGIRFKTKVKDDDGRWSGDDLVDRLSYDLKDRPSRSSSQASWQYKTIYGMRRKYKTVLKFKFQLYCNSNYYGSTCSVYCVSQNSDSRGHYTCNPTTGAKQCMTGFAGNTCEVNINDCADGPCENGGECVDEVNSFSCKCPQGFEGDRCETDINECVYRPCANGGECVDGVNSFSCKCPVGFEGFSCAVNVNDCAANQCENGGECIDGVNTFTCKCAVGFEGDRCELVSEPGTVKPWQPSLLPIANEAAWNQFDTLCIPVEEKKGDVDMYVYCEDHCFATGKAPACPESECQCFKVDPANVGSENEPNLSKIASAAAERKNSVCVPVETRRSFSFLYNWCATYCFAESPYCPDTRCECYKIDE